MRKKRGKDGNNECFATYNSDLYDYFGGDKYFKAFCREVFC